MQEGLIPPNHLASDAPPLPSPPPTEKPPDNAKFFNKKMMKKIKIVAGIIAIGGAIAGIVGSEIKKHHHES